MRRRAPRCASAWCASGGLVRASADPPPYQRFRELLGAAGSAGIGMAAPPRPRQPVGRRSPFGRGAESVPLPAPPRPHPWHARPRNRRFRLSRFEIRPVSKRGESSSDSQEGICGRQAPSLVGRFLGAARPEPCASLPLRSRAAQACWVAFGFGPSRSRR